MPEIFSAKLSTNIRYASVIIGFDNEVSVIIKHDLVPITFADFSKFELIGACDRVIDTIADVDSIRAGALNGEVILNLGKILTKTGDFNTQLVGYSAGNPNGVILWHPLMARASLKLKVTSL